MAVEWNALLTRMAKSSSLCLALNDLSPMQLTKIATHKYKVETK